MKTFFSALHHRAQAFLPITLVVIMLVTCNVLTTMAQSETPAKPAASSGSSSGGGSSAIVVSPPKREIERACSRRWAGDGDGMRHERSTSPKGDANPSDLLLPQL